MSTSYSGKWIRSFVWGCIAAACLVPGASTDGLAQVSVGIKAGVPFTGLLQSSSPISWQSYSVGSQAQKTQHYAIGPAVDIHLPGQFPGQYDLEVGVMYKSIQQQAPDVTLLGFTCRVPGTPLTDCADTQAIFQTQGVSRVGRSWEFPVAIRYHFSSPSLRPYVEGGYSYNHLSAIFVKPSFGVPNYNPRIPLPLLVDAPYGITMNRSGFLLGSGVEIKLPRIRVTPGVRFARYHIVGNRFSDPLINQTPVKRNAVDFVVGFNRNSKSSRSHR